MARHGAFMFDALTLRRGMVTIRPRAKLVLLKVEKYLPVHGVTPVKYKIYVRAVAIFLAFQDHFGYHGSIVIE